jgi:glycosyltransferase involved in cell wall biosynthesis
MNSKIKVVYILNSSNKYGGASKSFLTMLEGLMTKGIEPVVISPMAGGLCEKLEKLHITYSIIPYCMDIYPYIRTTKDYFLFIPRIFRTILYNNIAKYKLISYIKKIRPDIIHSNVGPVHIGYHIANKLNIPHVWHIREYQDLDFNMHPLYTMNSFKQKLKQPNNHCVAITGDIYKYFSLGDKDVVIYNGVLRKSNAQYRETKEKYFLFAGRLEANKGIKDVIEVFVEFAKKNNEYRLLIAGDTYNIVYKNCLYETVKKSKLENRIIFLGMRDDIYDLMASATALIVPSIHEGFGRITAEAMFNGCLVIGNNSAGTKEILEPEQLGILYNGQHELLAAMQTVSYNGVKSYYPTIMKAQKRAVELYSQEQNTENIYKLYSDIKNKQ